MAIRIMTDSACEIHDLLGVEILPISIEIDGITYLEGKDSGQEDFYKQKMRPRAERVTVGVTEEQFLEAFARFPDEDIVGIFTASKLSKTYANAVLAKNKLNRENIYLLDSGSASVGIAMLVECSVKLASCGCDAVDVYRKVLGMADKLDVYGIFDNIKHLAPYGRIKKSSVTTGAMPGIKSVVRIRGGVVQTMGQDVGTGRTTDLAVKLIRSKSKFDTNMPVAYIHRDNLTEVERLMDKLGRGKVYESRAMGNAQTGSSPIAIGFFNE